MYLLMAPCVFLTHWQEVIKKSLDEKDFYVELIVANRASERFSDTIRDTRLLSSILCQGKRLSWQYD